MATMTTRTGGARTFVVPITGTIPGAPFITGTSELEIETAPPGDRPVRVSYRFWPDPLELKLKLSKLAAALGKDPWELVHQLADTRPVVTYEGEPSGLPPSLSSLAVLEGFLTRQTPVFDPTRMKPVAIGFEQK